MNIWKDILDFNKNLIFNTLYDYLDQEYEITIISPEYHGDPHPSDYEVESIAFDPNLTGCRIQFDHGNILDLVEIIVSDEGYIHIFNAEYHYAMEEKSKSYYDKNGNFIGKLAYPMEHKMDGSNAIDLINILFEMIENLKNDDKVLTSPRL